MRNMRENLRDWLGLPAIKARLPVLRWELLLLVLVTGAILITRFPSLDTNLLDTGHAHRQTHVAWQTRGFYESGIDLLHPITPVLGEPYEIPNEFPLFQAVASTFASLGVPLDPANRVTALGFFILTAWLTWLLARELFESRLIPAIALIAFSFSPYALIWSRASVVEYLATAATLGWIVAIIYWFRTRKVSWWALGVISGGIAGLVKGSTPITWLALALIAGPWVGATRRERWQNWIRLRAHPMFVTLLVLPYLALAWWTNYADAIKAASPATEPLTVVASRGYWIGSVSQRLDADSWATIFDRVETLLVGPGVLLVLIAAVFVGHRHRRERIGLFLIPVIGIGGLFGSYVEVEYYLAAVSSALAILVGLAIVSLVRWLGIAAHRRTLSVVGITAAWLFLTLFLAAPRWTDVYHHRGLPKESLEIARNTSENDKVLVGGMWYDPRILYYADRWGLMLAEPWVTEDFVRNMSDIDEYRLLYSASQLSHLIDWAAVRPWYAPVDTYSLRIGGSRREVMDGSDYGIAATTLRPSELELSDPQPVPPLIGTVIPCTAGANLPIPNGPRFLVLGIELTERSRPVLIDGLLPVPATTRTVVYSPTARSGATLACLSESESGSLRVETAVEVDRIEDAAE